MQAQDKRVSSLKAASDGGFVLRGRIGGIVA
jgi:hypothetical protein